jgi:hypothetical protein
LVKWPEKAVSESSNELVQLSFMVQVERVRASLSHDFAVKVTHWSGAVLKINIWCRFTVTWQQMPCGNAGRSPSGKRRSESVSVN